MRRLSQNDERMTLRVATEPAFIVMRAYRRGKEFYSSNFQKAKSLYESGKSISNIAKEIGISYSAVYHWVKGIRKIETGNVNDFFEELRKRGPLPVIDIKERFAKHNELFHIAARRGLNIKRFMLKKKYGEYSTWYYIEGQEHMLNERIDAMLEKFKDVRKRLIGGITNGSNN